MVEDKKEITLDEAIAHFEAIEKCAKQSGLKDTAHGQFARYLRRLKRYERAIENGELQWKKPGEDVVDVVRCKDCKYCTKEIKWNGEEYLNCEMAAELADNGVEIDGNQFCSYGERREQ